MTRGNLALQRALLSLEYLFQKDSDVESIEFIASNEQRGIVTSETMLRLRESVGEHLIEEPVTVNSRSMGRDKGRCESRGVTMQHHDLWIAAAALEHEIPILTADGDFELIPGLATIKL
jgi:predicted nucleic acid-binding protein